MLFVSTRSKYLLFTWRVRKTWNCNFFQIHRVWSVNVNFEWVQRWILELRGSGKKSVNFENVSAKNQKDESFPMCSAREWMRRRLPLRLVLSSAPCTVLGVKISHGHDYTPCATLGHFEMEFWCGTHRYDTQTQCWVQSFIVRAAHFGARMLKRRPPREGGTPKRLKIWLFQGANENAMDWNFYRRILTPWPTISTGFHSPGHLALCATMQNPIIWAKGC